MPRANAGPSRLAIILKGLKRTPPPTLTTLQSLKLTLAAKNDHFGTRHFIKEDLPSIQYANPTLSVQVNKVPKKPDDKLKSEMLLKFNNGRLQSIDVSMKRSSEIYDELMRAAAVGRTGGEQKRRTTTIRASSSPSTPPARDEPAHIPSTATQGSSTPEQATSIAS